MQRTTQWERQIVCATLHHLVLGAVWMYLTEAPRHALLEYQPPPAGRIFSGLVGFIQGGAGVQGNALPSSHIALALLCALSAHRWLPRLATFAWICLSLICVDAVYDGYHYLSDVVAGLLVALTSAGVSSLTVSLSSKIEQPTRPSSY